MRGEHRGIRKSPTRKKGSSPHARGALDPTIYDRSCIGIIPACAGSTRGQAMHVPPRRDHPRMRGEHARPQRLPFGARGSSPHARGAPWRCRLRWGGLGIIPACAGSTSMLPKTVKACWDHPRMRGEHREGTGKHLADIGSSPHARGALNPPEYFDSAAGIIPACAGSTYRCCCELYIVRDHPRMRGEHISRHTLATSVAGSSPHARGAPLPYPASVSCLRIIPACAGST